MAAVTKPLGANWKNDSRFVCLWTLTENDATGDWLECHTGADKSVHVIFGSGSGSVAMQGTNEPGTPVSSFTLRDVTHTALAFTATGGAQILENTLKLRPLLTGAAGGTSILVYLCVNGN